MKIKSLTLCAVLLTLTGCIGIKPYQSITEGPRAKLNFSSPTIEGQRYTDTESEITLVISSADKHCKITEQGQIKLDSKFYEKSTFIPANKTGYFSIKYRYKSDTGVALITANDNFNFRFKPEAGKEYTISFEAENISPTFYNPIINIYEGTPAKPVADIHVSEWRDCKDQLNLFIEG